VIGNASQGTSIYGNPSDTPNASGNLTAAQICLNTGNVIITALPPTVESSVPEDSFAIVSELFVNMTNMSLFKIVTANNIYMRNFS
jgi:hypothetical protein